MWTEPSHSQRVNDGIKRVQLVRKAAGYRELLAAIVETSRITDPQMQKGISDAD